MKRAGHSNYSQQKCDAQTPTCGPCVRYARPGDRPCSYLSTSPFPRTITEGIVSTGPTTGPSRTGSKNRLRDLEEELARLQDRIRELEQPADAEDDSVRLIDPYPNQPRPGGENRGTIRNEITFNHEG